MALIVCRPVDASALHELAPDIPIPDPYPGSTKEPCARCEQKVWCGPNQRVLASEQSLEGANEHIIVCMLCSFAIIQVMQERGVEVGPVMALTNHTVPRRYQDGTVAPENFG